MFGLGEISFIKELAMENTARYRILLFFTLLFLFWKPCVNAQERVKSTLSEVLQKTGIELTFTPPTVPDFSVEALPGLEGEQEELRKQCVEVIKRWEVEPNAFWYDRYQSLRQIQLNLDIHLTYSHDEQGRLEAFRDQYPWRLEKLKECKRMLELLNREAVILFPQVVAALDKVLQNEQITSAESRRFYTICTMLFRSTLQCTSEEEGIANFKLLEKVALEIDAKNGDRGCWIIYDNSRRSYTREAKRNTMSQKREPSLKADSTADFDYKVISTYGPTPQKSIHLKKFKNKEATSVVIPKTIDFLPVESIGSRAFAGCTNLVSITLHAGITNIASSAFEGCTQLESITLPEGITEISPHTFQGCTQLKSITIPESVTKIGGAAFSNCSSLTSITIPEGVTTLGGWAFYGCTSLESVTIPDNVTFIADYLFGNCSSLKSVRFPQEATCGRNVFSGCALKTLELPNGIVKIEDGLLEDYTALETLIIPRSVTQIEDRYSVFPDCKNLKAIHVSPDNPNFKSVDGVLYSKDGHVLWKCPRQSRVQEYTVPDGVTRIAECAFYGCSNLVSVKLPQGVNYVGIRAFHSCPNLRSVTIPKSVWYLYDDELMDGAFDAPSNYPADFTIYGNPGSEAEKYAKEHNIRFVAE